MFCTKSSEAVELFLQMGDIDITDLISKSGKGCPLLWRCASMGIVSEKIASHEKLKAQIGMRWKGTIPLETGESILENDYLS